MKADVSTDASDEQRYAVNIKPLRQWDAEGQVCFC